MRIWIPILLAGTLLLVFTEGKVTPGIITVLIILTAMYFGGYYLFMYGTKLHNKTYPDNQITFEQYLYNDYYKPYNKNGISK